MGLALLALGAVACPAAPDDAGTREFRHASGIAFTYPAAWTLHDASATFSGGSVIAILGTQPVPAACGREHVDVTCYAEVPLAPAAISIVVGTGTFGGATLFDERPRPTPELARTQVEVGGLPAILHRYGPDPYSRQDEALGWEIAFPQSVMQAYAIEARLRGPGVAAHRAALDRLIASVAIAGIGPPVGTGEGAAKPAVEAALAELDRRERRSHVARPEHVTWYACFPPEAGVTGRRVISLGPDGPLERLRDVACRWTAVPESTHLWRVTLELDEGRERTTLWLTAAGALAGLRREPARPAPSAE